MRSHLVCLSNRILVVLPQVLKRKEILVLDLPWINFHQVENDRMDLEHCLDLLPAVGPLQVPTAVLHSERDETSCLAQNLSNVEDVVRWDVESVELTH